MIIRDAVLIYQARQDVAGPSVYRPYNARESWRVQDGNITAEGKGILGLQLPPRVNELLTADDFDLLNGRGADDLHAQEKGLAGQDDVVLKIFLRAGF